MYYDRTVSKCLLDELRPNGAFGFLAQLPRTWHLTDLQLRAYPGKPGCWATLYVGLTKVLDVHERNGVFRLAGKAGDRAWDPAWKEGHSADWFRNQPGVVAYVRGALGQVAERFTNEGAVQTMLCTRASQFFSVIDREAVVGFENTAARTAIYHAEQAPLMDACKAEPTSPWFKPKPFGGELDLLAADNDGRILVIEIKPASATSGIGWAPLQATFYTRLFRAWAGEAGDRCRQILESMLRQRSSLLARHGFGLDDHGRILAPSRALVRLPLEQLRDASAIQEHLDRLNAAADSDAPLAISSAKALVEATCKHVLEEMGAPYADRADVPTLARAVQTALKIQPDQIAPTAKGREAILRTLSNLRQVVSGLAELRNEYAPDRGRTRSSAGIGPRHANLAVGAAQTYCRFLLETLRDRRAAAAAQDRP